MSLSSLPEITALDSTSEGIRIFSLDSHTAVYKHAIGAVR